MLIVKRFPLTAKADTKSVKRFPLTAKADTKIVKRFINELINNSYMLINSKFINKEVKMKSMAIRETEVNWLDIINLALNRKDWGKKHNLYTAGDVTVYAELEDYNFRHNSADFKITVSYSYDEVMHTYYEWVTYIMKNFSSEDFTRLMRRKLIRLLSNAIENRTRLIAENKYQALKHSTWSMTTAKVIDAGFEEDLNAIKDLNSDIAEQMETALFETVTNELNKEYVDKVAAFCEEHPVKLKYVSKILKKLEERAGQDD